MPPIYRFLEVSLYSVINVLPFMLLALYPFRQQLRYGKAGTSILVILMTFLQILVRSAAILGPLDKGFLTIASTVIYAAFYFTAVKASFGKTLFTLLMLSNIADLDIIASKCMEGLVFGTEMATQSYRWTASVCLLAVSLIIAVPLSLYFRRYYSDGINKQAGAAAWNYLWLIPATFYLLWYCYTYESGKTTLEIALAPSSTLFTFLINVGAFLIYHTVVRLINELEKNQQLVAHNHQLALQNLQYENLNRQIATTRQVRHDIRHHITVMDAYLSSGEYDKLHEYLQSYKKSIQDDITLLFCKHYAANALLLYFAQQARERTIDFSVSADLPARVGVPDNVLSVLLGNLLENAIDACSMVKNRRAEISVKIKTESDAIFFQINNTCNHPPVKGRNEHYLSSKHKGEGIGLESVRSIVEQYEGILEMDQNNGWFCVSILLNIP